MIKALLERFGNLFTALFIGIGVCILAGALVTVIVISHYSEGLPDYQQLEKYAPATITRIYSADGVILAEYAREKRLYVPVTAIPRRLINAFISAEDKNFYHHPGVDFIGTFRAAMTNIANYGSNRSLVGGSTITQQVVKNFLLTNEKSFERKIKEAILAFRITQAFPKDRILELYLNEIYLGNRSYGVAAAALNYFNKSLTELTIEEAALLASLPKAPSDLDPRRNPKEAKARRNWVIKRMEEEGYINEVEAVLAISQPIRLQEREETELANAGYFADTVRAEIESMYGEDAIFKEGLSIHTTLDSRYQKQAEQALSKGLRAYDRRHGWRGAPAHIELETTKDDKWITPFKEKARSVPVGDFTPALVLSVSDSNAKIGFKDGSAGTIPLKEMKWARKFINQNARGPRVSSCKQVVDKGDIIPVSQLSKKANTYRLEQIPNINGSIVVIDPHTGKVLAMVGGYDYSLSQFNRAVQAARQPGSGFKPFVYLAALENGFAPNSIIVDEEVQLNAGDGQEVWKPQNHTGDYYGPTTLRVGVEKSRNAMTVRLANNVGIDTVLEVGERFGIFDHPARNLSTVLGASETHLLSLTNAYAMLVNGGKEIHPSLIERIQNRNGKTIFRWDKRQCDACTLDAHEEAEEKVSTNSETTDTKQEIIPPPVLEDYRKQITDPIAAYQMTSILEGVVQRGTGRAARSIHKTVGGKTGTTNDSIDSWFLGFSADLAVGVYSGFDTPKSLGAHEYGSTVALPIWIDFMKDALANQPDIPFRRPAGIRLVKIDATTGKIPSPNTPSSRIILEAFREGTEPHTSLSGEEDMEGSETSGEGTIKIDNSGIY